MRNQALGVVALFLLIYILPLGWRPLAIPDETRYAEIPREMIASGDWVVPRLNGLKYFEKPVLGYWLNASSILLLGENAFAVRLPSALSVGLTALLIFFLMRRFGGGPEAASIGAGAYLTCLLVLALGVISTLDSMLTLFLSGAMTFFFFAYQEGVPTRRLCFLILFGAFCGLAFLVKGFLAFAIPAIVIIPFLVWEGRLKPFIRLAWMPILGLLLVALPWGILIHLREGDFWTYFFWVEHVRRFLSPLPGQHPKPFWYFLPILAGGAFPWTTLLPATVPDIRSALRRREPLVRYAICWVLFPFVFFSACSGKLVPYIIPCFPPLIILIIIGVMAYFKRGNSRAFTMCAVSLAVFLFVILIVAVLIQVVSISGMRLYDPSEFWKFIVAVTGFLAWAAGAVLAVRSRSWRKRVALFMAAPLPLLFSAHGIIPNHVFADRAPERLLLRNQDKVHSETLIITGDHLVHAVCWVYQRNDAYLLETAGELAYGLKHDDSRPPRLVTLKDLPGFLDKHLNREGWVLFLKCKK